MSSNTVNQRINFASTKNPLEYPDFLEVQLKSFKDFLQLDTPPEKRKNEGLYKVFAENFPIADTRNNFVLEFLDYYIDPPRYTIDDCIERGLTYSVPLKAKLKLYCTDPDHEDFDTVIQDVFLGPIPYMTDRRLSSSTVRNVWLYLSFTVLQAYSSVRAYMLMVPNFILPVSFRSKVHGLSLLLILTMSCMRTLTVRRSYPLLLC